MAAPPNSTVATDETLAARDHAAQRPSLAGRAKSHHRDSDTAICCQHEAKVTRHFARDHLAEAWYICRHSLDARPLIKRRDDSSRYLFPLLIQRGVHAAIGGIALPNTASVALHERFGLSKVAHFTEVGFKFGRWIDVGYWQRNL